MTVSTPSSARNLSLFVLAMCVVVALSNYLVQFPFKHFGMGEILTWGAFTYPVAFLITDLANRRFGVVAARKIVLFGFVLAVLLSIWLATPRIAIASGSAFLVAQLLDIAIFNRLRNRRWWLAPLASSLIGSAIDTLLFFSLAFAAQFAMLDLVLGRADGSLAFAVPFFGFGIEVPLWMSLAVGDYLVKILIALSMLLPYRLLIRFLRAEKDAMAAAG